MKPRAFRRHRSVAWLALVAIVLLALAPTISQVQASLTQHAHHGHTQTSAETSDPHSGHAAHAHDEHAAGAEDCWRACGYCDLFNHTPAVELSAGGVRVAVDLPPVGVEATIGAPAHAIPRRSAQPRGPPSPAV